MIEAAICPPARPDRRPKTELFAWLGEPHRILRHVKTDLSESLCLLFGTPERSFSEAITIDLPTRCSGLEAYRKLPSALCSMCSESIVRLQARLCKLAFGLYRTA